jgi:hypothetical protein
MNHVTNVSLLAGGLFFGMLILLETGRRIGVRRLAEDAKGARAGLGVVDGALFSLLGLLVAFTFSSAAARFEARRQLIVMEANDIGTAYLRLDLLPAGAQPALRDLFRRYVDSRLEAYRKMPDLAAAREELARATTLQGEIWAQAVAACRDGGGSQATMLLLPALNAMFDITTTRTAAGQMHQPVIIFFMLGLLALVGSLLAGYGMAGGRTRSWIHILGFAAAMTISVYVILDLEYPRLGFIRVDAMDQVLVEVRQSMK